MIAGVDSLAAFVDVSARPTRDGSGEASEAGARVTPWGVVAPGRRGAAGRDALDALVDVGATLVNAGVPTRARHAYPVVDGVVAVIVDVVADLGISRVPLGVTVIAVIAPASG